MFYFYCLHFFLLYFVRTLSFILHSFWFLNLSWWQVFIKPVESQPVIWYLLNMYCTLMVYTHCCNWKCSVFIPYFCTWLTEFCSLFLALPSTMACFLSALCSFDIFLLFGYGQTKRLIISAFGKQIVFEPGNRLINVKQWRECN